jgi:hypothetical protein
VQSLQQLWEGLISTNVSRHIHEEVGPNGEDPHEKGPEHHCPHGRDYTQESKCNHINGQDMLGLELLHSLLQLPLTRLSSVLLKI